jgi:AmmeMemoRadiSam system protein A
MKVEQVLLEVARTSILNKFNKSFSLNKEELLKEYEVLNEQRACFVSLNLNGRLRGCIGSLIAHKSLFDDVYENAQKAAFHDPRFKQLSQEEFKYVHIELSVLTPAVKIEYKDASDLKDKIKEGVHGVILELDGKRATYLPQVWEQIASFDDFFESLSKKAGFNESVIEKHPKIYAYTAIKIK